MAPALTIDPVDSLIGAQALVGSGQDVEDALDQLADQELARTLAGQTSAGQPGERAARMLDLSGPTPDFTRISTGLGVPATRVTTAAELDAELRRDCLPAVVDAADGLPVLFDSGVRSGADVIKALALGATAVAVGRPHAYGLAIGGVDGIVHVLRSILAEADLIMAVDGYPTRADLTRDSLRRTCTCHHD